MIFGTEMVFGPHKGAFKVDSHIMYDGEKSYGCRYSLPVPGHGDLFATHFIENRYHAREMAKKILEQKLNMKFNNEHQGY